MIPVERGAGFAMHATLEGVCINLCVSTMDLTLLASVYAIIFLAELPDKTALASLFLATRIGRCPRLWGLLWP